MELGNIIIGIFFLIFFIIFMFIGGTRIFAILILDYSYWKQLKWWNYIIYPIALLILCALSPLIMFMYGINDDFL